MTGISAILFESLKSEFMILPLILYVLGVGLKKSSIPDKWIPGLLGVVGCALSTLQVFSAQSDFAWSSVASYIYTGITQGLLAAGASVYVNQLYVQSKKEH